MNHLFIIGAQRSGSTYLYQLLDEHPAITMAKPVRPEPKYFLNQGLQNFKYSDYLKYFDPHNPNSIWYGEKGTSYIEYPKVCRTIFKLFNQSKFIVILRNPVNRAISNYYFSRNNGIEKRNITDALDPNTNSLEYDDAQFSVNPFNYLTRGHYANYIQALLTFLPEQNLRIIIFEELINNTNNIKYLYNWLNISNDFVPKSLNVVINKSNYEQDVPNMVIVNLTEYYAKYNTRLEQLISQDLSVWKSPN